MKTEIRTQNDGDQDIHSRYADIVFDDANKDDRSVTRQEMKDDADVNKLLARYGIGAFQNRGAQYSEIDFDIDLQTALHAIQEAQTAYSRMPAGLKERFPTWQSVLNAIDAGQLTFDMTKPEPEPIKETSTKVDDKVNL